MTVLETESAWLGEQVPTSGSGPSNLGAVFGNVQAENHGECGQNVTLIQCSCLCFEQW